MRNRTCACSQVFGMICAIFFSLVSPGFAMAQQSTEEGPVDKDRVGGFHFQQNDGSHITISRPSSLSSNYLFSADGSVQLVGEVSGSPFVFHAGPQYCGWIGVPGLGWYGCGIHPYSTVAVAGHRETNAGGVSQDIQLTEGMKQEDVLDAIGLPVRRIRLGLREVWEFASFSLLFESGRLKEIR